jgi:catechol 2,3-dioxygenase-like lactoylglutathione lyase family enzyme
VSVGIVARDADRLVAFYRDFLGLPLDHEVDAPDGAHLWFFQVGTGEVKIVRPAATPDAANPSGGIRGATGIRYFTIRVADLDPVVNGIDAAGGRLSGGRVIEFGGSRLAICYDPEGNTVELAERRD